MPSVWIMNGLHCRSIGTICPWDVVGVTFPGAPAVVLGHNARIAWGATNVEPDTQDLFLETVDPADPDGHYLYQGASVPFDVRHETIKVAGGADVELDVRSTRHGVVLSDVDERLKDGPVLAMRWTTTAEVDLALETFFKVDLATSFEEFRAAFDGYGSPSQNFIYRRRRRPHRLRAAGPDPDPGPRRDDPRELWEQRHRRLRDPNPLGHRRARARRGNWQGRMDRLRPAR